MSKAVVCRAVAIDDECQRDRVDRSVLPECSEVVERLVVEDNKARVMDLSKRPKRYDWVHRICHAGKPGYGCKYGFQRFDAICKNWRDHHKIRLRSYPSSSPSLNLASEDRHENVDIANRRTHDDINILSIVANPEMAGTVA